MTEPPTPRALAAWADAQYDNRARVPAARAILARWAADSAAARAATPGLQVHAYGDGPDEVLDVFPPAPAAAPGPGGAPVLVWLHGGYWRALSRHDQSFLAAPLAAAGALVLVPDYSLAPRVTVRHIVLQAVRAIAWAWQHAAALGGDPARLVVGGHSAGGQLAAMALACRWPQLAPGLPAAPLRAALAVSGVYDLEPLRHAPFLAGDLRLDAAEAAALSPARLPLPRAARSPGGRPTIACVVGGDESPEFLRQNGLLRRAWGRARVPVCEVLPGLDHFTVLDALAQPGTRLHGLVLGLLGLPAPGPGAASS